MKGLLRIKEFDSLLREKNEVPKFSKFLFLNQTARELKKERLKRDSRTGTPNSSSGFSTPPSYHNILSDEEEDNHLELRSIHSEENPVFLTEPTFKKANAIVRDTRLLVGKQILGLSSSKKKGYIQGDFIGRNIAVISNFSLSFQLGPDARFYHALTEDEKIRVENIIKETILDDSIDREVAHTIIC